MARRSRRSRRKPYKVVKYSNETQDFSDTLPATPNAKLNMQATMVPALNVQGMRKCKNFTLQIITTSRIPITFALVYVPQGTTPSALSFGSPGAPLSMYEPNQNVIMSGTVIDGSAQQTWRTRLARNLNSGDYIALVLGTADNFNVSAEPAISVTFNYAITY